MKLTLIQFNVFIQGILRYVKSLISFHFREIQHNMEQFNRLILLLMTTLFVTQATIIQTFYDKVESGQNITGNITAELTTRSRIQCSNRLVIITRVTDNCIYLILKCRQYKNTNIVYYAKTRIG